MDYIIFMVSIQSPILYVLWRFFQKQNTENKKLVRSLKKQNEHIAHFMDTLKMSIERISEDIYGKGKINSRFFEIEKNYSSLKEKIYDMETYTGLNNADSYSPSPVLKEKDFI